MIKVGLKIHNIIYKQLTVAQPLVNYFFFKFRSFEHIVTFIRNLSKIYIVKNVDLTFFGSRITYVEFGV